MGIFPGIGENHMLENIRSVRHRIPAEQRPRAEEDSQQYKQDRQ
jgi:hypothetical protein